MNKLTITTNNHWRDFIYGYELTDDQKADFDYIDDIESHDFIKYRDYIYDPCEFMRIDMGHEGLPGGFESWGGYQSDSFFSGVLIRYSEDCEQYQIATYYS